MADKNDFNAYKMFCDSLKLEVSVSEFAEFVGNPELIKEFTVKRQSVSGCGSCGGGKVR